MLKKTIFNGGIKSQDFHSETLKATYNRVTRRMSQESERYFGERGLPVFSIVRIFRRPFSDIIQCTVQLNNIFFGIYIKVALVNNVKGEHERILKNTTREVEVIKSFFEFFSNEQTVSVPEVIAFFPDEMAIVTKEKEGASLMDLIVGFGKGRLGNKNRDLLKQACCSIGNAIMVFQKMPLINTGNDELPSNLISYVDLRLKLLLDPGFIAMKDYRNILNFLEQQLAKIDGQPWSPCGVHGDFSLGNVLISSDQAVFLDLGMYRQGPSCFDLSYFCQHLDDFLSNPFFFKSTITLMQDAFFEGYQDDSIRQTPLFLSYYVRNSVNQLLDLSRTKDLSLLRRVNQKRQFIYSVSSLKSFIQVH